MSDNLSFNFDHLIICQTFTCIKQYDNSSQRLFGSDISRKADHWLVICKYKPWRNPICDVGFCFK